MPLKQVKFKVEFVLEINEIDEEDAYEHYQLGTEDGRKNFGNTLHHQKKLLSALLNNEEVFKKYVKRIFPFYVTDYAAGLLDSKLENSQEENASIHILEALIETLPEEDRKYFKAAEDKGLLWENLELLFFTPNLDVLNVSVE